MSLPSIEQLKRQQALQNALAAVMLNHKTPSADVTALLIKWAEDELSLDDVLLSTQALYRETKPS